MFSCIKDAEHQFFIKNYAAINIEATTSVIGSIIRFSANVSNYGSEEIIDHGFIWGTRTTDYRNFTDEDLDKWIANGSDVTFRNFLLEKGTTISLGKLDKIGQFTYDENTVVIGRKHFVMAYIKTNKYMIYSNVEIFEHPLSSAWNKITLTYNIPIENFCYVNNKVYVYFNREIAELRSDYRLYNQQPCPDYLWGNFVIDDVVYLFNNSSIWKYNTEINTWAVCESNLPDINYSFWFSFTQNRKYYNFYYAYPLQRTCIFEFDPNTYIWTQRNKCEIDVIKNPNLFYYKDKAYVYCTNELWYFNEDLATFQLKSNIDIGSNWIYPIVTLNDKVYMISRNGSVIDLFVCDPENNTAKKFCSLHDYFTDFFAYVVVINNKIVFIPSDRQSHLYELDISKF